MSLLDVLTALMVCERGLLASAEEKSGGRGSLDRMAERGVVDVRVRAGLFIRVELKNLGVVLEPSVLRP